MPTSWFLEQFTKYSTNCPSCINKLPPSTICHWRGFSAISARGPGILCHPAEIVAVMRLGRKPQLWSPRKHPFHVLLAGPPSPLATSLTPPLHQLPWGSRPRGSCCPFPGKGRVADSNPLASALKDVPRNKSRRGTQLQGQLLSFSEGSSFLLVTIWCSSRKFHILLPSACFHLQKFWPWVISVSLSLSKHGLFYWTTTCLLPLFSIFLLPRPYFLTLLSFPFLPLSLAQKYNKYASFPVLGHP